MQESWPACGGSTSVGDGGPTNTGCTGMELPPGNRCTTPGPTVAAGGQLLIDNLEPAAGDTAVCHRIAELDGRKGSWNSGKDLMSPNGSVVHSFEAPGAGAAPGSTRAIHVVGQGLNGYGGYLAVPLAPCYDASKYQGISFWLKGDPTKAPWMKLSIMTPPTVQASEGGACVQPLAGSSGLQCYDNFSVNLFKVSNVWTRYAITWQQLAQYGWGQPVPVTYRSQTQIIGINFSPVWANDKALNKAFDLWVDNLSFDVAGPFADTGLQQTMSATQFNTAFPNRNQLYSDGYNQLVAALNDPRFSRIGREGSLQDRKREIAAMMAHIWWETGGAAGDSAGLTAVREISPTSNYCQADVLYPCASGQTYIGRGPLQLSWNYNYGQAGDYLGVPALLTNPDQVATNAALTWRASMFFWMAWRNHTTNSLLVGPHYRFLHDGFGGTIRAINGMLECAPGNTQADQRRRMYKQFCATLGVTPCDGCDQSFPCPPE